MNRNERTQRFMVGDLVKIKGDVDAYMGLVTRTFFVHQDTVVPTTGTRVLPAVNISWVDGRNVSYDAVYHSDDWPDDGKQQSFYYERILELVQRVKR